MEALGISKDTAKLHAMFGKRLYNSKYSFLSEVCQNAVDSHRMAKSKELVEIGIRPSTTRGAGTYTFYVRDRGISFEDEADFKAKICVLMESGKSEEKTSDEDCPMGMHGIGSIAVSAYNPKWQYTVYNGNKSFVAKFEEKEGQGIMYDPPKNYFKSTEPKGVLFEVEVIHSVQDLITNIKSKLAFFKDVKFVCPEKIMQVSRDAYFFNSLFKLYETDDFMISTLYNTEEMCLCVDQYNYEIKWKQLGIAPIKLPIGLKFSLADGLTPDITRENLIVDDKYKAIILAKIKKVCTWLVERYNVTVPSPYTDLTKMIEEYKLEPVVEIGDKVLNLAQAKNHSTVPLAKKLYKTVPQKPFETFYNLVMRHGGQGVWEFLNVEGYKKVRSSGTASNSANIYDIRWADKVYTTDIELTKKHIQYFKTTGETTVICNKREKPVSLIFLKKHLSLPTFKEMRTVYAATGVNPIREALKPYKILHDDYLAIHTQPLSKVVIPEKIRAIPLVINRRESPDVANLTGEVALNISGPGRGYLWDRYSCREKNITFTKNVVKLKDLKTYATNKTVVYGWKNELEQLTELAKLNTKSLYVCTISPKDQKAIEQLNYSNFMKIEEYLKSSDFPTEITKYLIKKELKSIDFIIGYQQLIHKYFPKTEVVKQFKEYTTLVQNSPDPVAGGKEAAFVTSSCKVVIDNGLLTQPMWDEFQVYKAKAQKYDFIHKVINLPTSEELFKEIGKYREVE